MHTKNTLLEFDAFLQKNNATFSAVVIGGASLNLLGVISRETRDCDILDPNIPEKIKGGAGYEC